nr:IS1 family transposase [Epilithonimonas arachidiradicis]
MIENHYRCVRVSDTGICPFCYSGKIIRNGSTKTRKQQYICKNCHKRFLDCYTYKAYHSNINPLIIQLIKEGLGIRSMARVLQISATTVLRRIKSIAENIVPPVLPFGKIYELDEMRFFIRKKSNPMWLFMLLIK